MKSVSVGQTISSQQATSRERVSVWNVYLPYILIAIVIAVGVLLRLSDYPLPWFDEGYTTHVSHLLIEKGVYGTYNGIRFSPYDPFVSSGPGVVLPIAFMFKVFGDGILQARLALFPYSILFGLALFALARYLYGQTMAFVTILVVLVSLQLYSNTSHTTLDVSPLMIGRQVLGEVPALSMIFLGLMIWFISWDRQSVILSIVAGLICGIGTLSKMQTGFGLGPALFFIAVFRTLKDRRNIVLYFTPLFIVVLTVIAWMGFQRLSAPAELRPEYAQITSLAIIVHYIIGLFGRILERRVLLVSAVVGLIIVSRLAVLALQSRKERVITNRQWAEVTLISFALFYLVWYFSLSVGWERYLFPAFIVTCIFAAKLAWDVVKGWFLKLEWAKRFAPDNINRYMVAISAVAVMLTAVSVMSWTDPDTGAAQQAVDYIRANIPQDAMIESWEWELDSASDHLKIHHPDSTYVINSIWDLAMHQPIELQYDMLQANPDYLIAGRFSGLTSIYKFDDVGKNFELLVTFGPYHIYKRK